MLKKPDSSEYAPYFAGYIDLVPSGHLLSLLSGQLDEWNALFSGITNEKGNYRYQPEKWSLKEILGHISDTERVMSYRALRIARGDKTPLPGFDQDRFVRSAGFERREVGALLEEFNSVRRATVTLLSSFTEEDWLRSGWLSGWPEKEMSVRALGYVIVGHATHHLKIINERYM